MVPASIVALVAMAATATAGPTTAHSSCRASVSVAMNCRKASTATPRATGPARVLASSPRARLGPSCQTAIAHDGSSTKR